MRGKRILHSFREIVSDSDSNCKHRYVEQQGKRKVLVCSKCNARAMSAYHHFEESYKAALDFQFRLKNV